MPDPDQLMAGLGLVVVAAPLLLVCLLGITSLFDWKLEEETTDRAVQVSIISGLLAALLMLGLMLTIGARRVPLDVGNWVELPAAPGAGQDSYRFSIKFDFDRLSVPFAILCFV